MAYRSRILSVGPGGGIRTPCSARSLNIQQSPGFGAPVEIAGVSPWAAFLRAGAFSSGSTGRDETGPSAIWRLQAAFPDTATSSGTCEARSS